MPDSKQMFEYKSSVTTKPVKNTLKQRMNVSKDE